VPSEKELVAEIEAAEAEFAALERARAQALARLKALRTAGSSKIEPPQLCLPMTTAVPASRTGTEKIRLFRTLFRGREDVFPKRWENAKQREEWVRGSGIAPWLRRGRRRLDPWPQLGRQPGRG
jgi:hypothetical protein